MGICFTHGVLAIVTLSLKICLGSISDTIRCRNLIVGRKIGQGYRCEGSWCDIDLTFDLVDLYLYNTV